MKIAITGALGHIGSRLSKELPYEMVLIDIKDPYFIDIMDCELEDIFRNIDVVIHLAAIVDAENSHKVKELVEFVNVEGSRRVAEACVKTGAKMIMASTTSVYGKQDVEVDETCENLQPQSVYAESKIKAESVLSSIPELKYVILRMGTIFGISDGMRFHTAVNKFCYQAACNKPITVWRTAMNQNRPYLGLDDLVRAIKFIVDNNLFNREIYNLVTVNTTVSDIVSMLPSVVVNYVDSEIMNQLSYTISNKKFCSLGFQFEDLLEENIRETLSFIGGK